MRCSVLALAIFAVLSAILLATQCNAQKSTTEASEDSADTTPAKKSAASTTAATEDVTDKKGKKSTDAAESNIGASEAKKDKKKPANTAAAAAAEDADATKDDAKDGKTDKKSTSATTKKPKATEAEGEKTPADDGEDADADKSTKKSAKKPKATEAEDEKTPVDDGEDADAEKPVNKSAKKTTTEAPTDDTDIDSGSTKPNKGGEAAIAKCREAARTLRSGGESGDLFIDQTISLEVTRAFKLQDLATSPVIKPVLNKFGVTNVVATDWRKDVEGNVRRRYTYDVEQLGFKVRVTDRNRMKPESSKSNCYSAVKTITLASANGSKLPMGANVKIEINSIIFATSPGGAQTRILVAVKVSGLDEVEQSLYESIGKDKLKEGFALLAKKLKEYAAKNGGVDKKANAEE